MTDDLVSIELPLEVRQRIAEEFPDRAQRIVAGIRTAARFIDEAKVDEDGLRLAESAAYNLREALGTIVKGRDPAEGGLHAIRAEWMRYQLALKNDEDAHARAELDRVLARVLGDRARDTHRALQLLAYLRTRAGVDPLDGVLGPVAEYSELLADVNGALHGTCDWATASALLDRAVSWLIRMFTPPDDQARLVSELAGSAYTGPHQLEELRQRIVSPHHLRLFFAQLADPTWLKPMYEAGTVGFPRPGEVWPVTALIDRLGRTSPNAVAELLLRLLADAHPGDELRDITYFEALRMAAHLGNAGHPVVADVVRRYSESRAVRSVGIRVALDADPAAPVVVQVARTVLRPDERPSREWGVFEILGHLVTGLGPDNARERVRLLAGKLRVATDQPLAQFTTDIASLRAGVNGDHDPAIVLAHHLVALIRDCRSFDVSTEDLRGWIREIPGPVGERVTCQVLVGATDVPVIQKIDHVTLRLRSLTATGDDRDLVNAILSTGPSAGDIEPWRVALGVPSQPDEEPVTRHSIPDDWARAWRWSAFLPDEVLTEWRNAIQQVSEHHGEPSADAFDVRGDRFQFTSSESPHPAEDLAELPVADAARRVSSWRPDPSDFWNVVSVRELARTLQSVVAGDVRRWTENPGDVIAQLSEPVYVLHYLEALAEKASELNDRATVVLDAVAAIPVDQWEPTPLGPDDGYSFEPTWKGLETNSNRLVRALANADGEITARFDWAWDRAVTTIHNHPENADLRDIMGDRDALHSAINRPWGIALETVLALTRWEVVHAGPLRPRFTTLLDQLIAVHGAVGMEFRAILASRRPLLESLVPAWLDDRADALFRNGELGPATFDLTLKWARPTPWLFDRFQDDVFASAMRSAENALSHVLIATLHGDSGYGIDEVLKQLRTNEAVLRAAVEEVPSLVQSAEPGSPELAVAVRFWRALLDANRQVVPASALDAAGRWVFVTGLPHSDWLQLTARTVQLTGGTITYPIEIADRCVATPPDGTVLRLLTAMVDHGEPWERSYVQGKALVVLQTATDQQVGPEFALLRTRLIELGRHEAVPIVQATRRAE